MTVMPELSKARVLAALDPENDKLVQQLVEHLATKLWCHGDTPGDVVREMIRLQRQYAGLDTENPYG